MDLSHSRPKETHPNLLIVLTFLRMITGNGEWELEIIFIRLDADYTDLMMVGPELWLPGLFLVS